MRHDMADAPQVTSEDPLEVIEVATAVLVRNFELLRRRSGIYTELDRAEYLLLRTLEALGPADICTLAAGLGLDPSTAGRQVARMADRDLVERTPAPEDRRRSVMAPTPKGLERMHEVRDRRRDSTAELLSDWSEEDRRTLAEMFTRYNRTVAERFLTGAPREPAVVHLPATEALLPHAAVPNGE